MAASSDFSPEQSDRADQSDRVKPWTIKGIAPEERNAAIQAADREGQTIGEWLTRAIRTQVRADRQSNRAPVLVDPPSDRRVDLADIERMVGLAEKIAVTNGQPIPASIARSVHGLMRRHLRAIKDGRTWVGLDRTLR